LDGRLALKEFANRFGQVGRRFETELLLEEPLACVVLTNGLSEISLSNVRLDQSAVCSFTQGLPLHGGNPGGDGRAKTTSTREAFAKRLEGMK